MNRRPLVFLYKDMGGENDNDYKSNNKKKLGNREKYWRD